MLSPVSPAFEPEFFRMIAEDSLAGIYVVGSDGHLVYANPAIYAMFGYSEGEVIGKLGPLQLTHPDHQAGVMEKMGALLAGDIDSVRAVYRGAHKDPREMYFEVMARGATMGQEPAIVGTVVDMTDRVLKERELRHYRDHLESTVEERTSELAEINRELTAFATSVSHDLRVPARAVMGFTKALIEDYGDHLDEQAVDYLYRIDKAGKKMEDLIEDMLALSRAASGILETTTVNLSALVREMFQDLADSAPERLADFKIQGGVAAEGDQRLLEVLLQNLTANAWKFTKTRDRSEIAFGCTLIQDANGNEQPACFLRDNGIGFDMADADRLFLPFERLHAGGNFEGNGLGLATVRRIVRRHGGRVWAESRPDRGSTFWIHLPGFGVGLVARPESAISAPQEF